jgi:diguanylate cyclase (GGDEF)-like protein
LRAQLPLSLIMLDIDGFKAYNDHYGHTSGDGALRQVAEVIREAAKRPGDQTCRYGGEEFVVILPGADLEGARHVAESIRASVEAAAIAHERSVTGRLLTVSVGITSTIPTVEDTPSVFITRSDEALYRAKAAGRNRVE